MQIAAVCLAAAILGAVLRQHSPETAAVLGLAVCAVVGVLRHAVEGEKAHASPVQRAHDHQDQRNAVYDLQRDSLPFSRNICLIMPAPGRDIQKIFARLKIFLISAVSDCNPGREYV